LMALIDNNMNTPADRGMIGPEGRSDEVRK
jgi:hypothetical protein